MIRPPDGYLGAEGRLASGPSAELVEAGYGLELADAGILHESLGLADLSHVLELYEIGVVPRPAAAALCRELLDFLSTEPDSFPYDPVYGDAYNSRERELERRLGSVAGWLPTGRTRREAGRIAIRLVLGDLLLDLHRAVANCTTTIAERAEDLASVNWNDTTYLQPAQPSSFGYYLSGFAEQGVRNLARIQACYGMVNRSPGGSGGVAGSAIPLDRVRMAERLGFERPTDHIRDGMWSADPMIDCGMAAFQAGLMVDRLAEDLEIFASPQFGYVTLGGGTSRASVLLPQKRNPYALAVIRGGVGTLIGRVTGLMVTQRTPSARTDNWLYLYGEIAGTLEMATRLVRLADQLIATLKVQADKLEASAGAYFSAATDLADRLVMAERVDYRTAYRVVGRAVAAAMRQGREDLTARDVVEAAEATGTALSRSRLAMLVGEVGEDPAGVVASRDVIGGAAPSRVRKHCRSVCRAVGDSSGWATAMGAMRNKAVRALLGTATSLAEIDQER